MRYGFDSNFDLATREQKAWLTSGKRERHCYERSSRILVISYFLCCIAFRPQPHKERPSHFGQDRQVKMWNDEGRIGSTDRCTSVIVGRRDSNRKLPCRGIMGKSGRISWLPVAYLAPGLVPSLGNSIIRTWPYALDVAKGWIRLCFGVSYSESILLRKLCLGEVTTP